MSPIYPSLIYQIKTVLNIIWRMLSLLSVLFLNHLSDSHTTILKFVVINNHTMLPICFGFFFVCLFGAYFFCFYFYVGKLKWLPGFFFKKKVQRTHASLFCFYVGKLKWLRVFFFKKKVQRTEPCIIVLFSFPFF